jgi:N-acetylmuramoyl-L-alanine amidase
VRIANLESPNCDERPGGAAAIDMLILHYTGMRNAGEAIDRLRDPAAKVSSHYVIDEDGAVLRLVAEEKRAYHAGLSYWRGRRALNDVSIGIEIVNPGHEWGYRPFPPVQMAAVRDLCLGILSRHAIPARNVVGHSDVAPNRKQDPGELFDWGGLAADGIGVWPITDEAPAADVSAALLAIGYDPDIDQATVLRAFQRHWCAQNVDGQPDTQTRTRLASVRVAIVRLQYP